MKNKLLPKKIFKIKLKNIIKIINKNNQKILIYKLFTKKNLKLLVIQIKKFN